MIYGGIWVGTVPPRRKFHVSDEAPMCSHQNGDVIAPDVTPLKWSTGKKGRDGRDGERSSDAGTTRRNLTKEYWENSIFLQGDLVRNIYIWYCFYQKEFTQGVIKVVSWMGVYRDKTDSGLFSLTILVRFSVGHKCPILTTNWSCIRAVFKIVGSYKCRCVYFWQLFFCSNSFFINI